MCRIVGKISRERVDNFEKGLRTMLNSVKHGGPDDEGIYIDGAVALGHRRLSIIDLSIAGHQPMVSVSSDLVISYNGEIYNYLNIKNELQNKGFSFKTQTDTEVILAAYQNWGTEAFDRFEGIFAFALYDKRRELFFLVRDHLGVKPLYYFLNEHELLFSSEVRAFKALRSDWKENEDWKILFLAFGSIPHPYTTLSQVVQLVPGSYLQLNLKNFEHTLTYYFRFNIGNYTVNTSQEALSMTKDYTVKGLKKNLISDAPLGVFLSGGIDSSLLTLLADQFAKNVRTISVNFKDSRYDESQYQQMVLKKTFNVKHTAHYVTEQMFWDQLDDIWNAMDQPSIDGVNSYFVTRCAKQDGIKAVLSGLGADEIFGGYASFKRMKWMRRFRMLPAKKQIASLFKIFRKQWGRLVYLTLPGAIGDYLFLRGIYTPIEIGVQLKIPENRVWDVLGRVPFREANEKLNDVEYASQLETKIYMSNQLLKDTDYMGMWHGVEVRVPFLDIELLKLANSIPPSLRYKDSWPKYLLTASNQDILPKEIIFREKKGFTFPFALWMKRSSKQFRALMPVGEEADRVCHEFEKGNAHWSKCWSLAVLQQFK
jgi:asparagine synthase (glutamine-hydrolysing)